MTRSLAAVLVGLLGLAAPAERPRPAAGSGGFRSPLDAPAPLVSTFGEYRFDHLHPGIDFSTGGRTGLPVRAAADGEIYRLKVEWRGYGRAIYLRHPGGRISVYAHLERYEDGRLGLERRAAAERLRKGRYPGDIFLDPPVPVRRGDRIGYTGESGAGLPHLHFEIRREDQEPAEPLHEGWAASAGAAVVFESMVILPDDPGTWIDGSREREIPLSRTGAGVYTGRPVRVSGPILPLARVAGRDAEGRRLGLREISVRVDGVLTYRYRLRSFRFADYPKVGRVMDHARSGDSSPTYAYFLRRLPGNDLGVAGVEQPWPPLAEGDHRIEVEAVGPGGETARAILPFRMDSSARPAAPARGSGAAGRAPAGESPEALPARVEIFRGFVDVLPARGAGETPVVVCVGDRDRPSCSNPVEDAAGALRATFPAGIWGEAREVWAPVGSPGAGRGIPLGITPRGPAGETPPREWPECRIRIALASDSLFEPSALGCETLDSLPVPEGLVPRAPAVRLLPAGLPLTRRVDLDLQLPGGSPERVGVYRWDASRGRWIFLPSEVVEGEALRVRVGRLDTFRLIRDDAAPRIAGIEPSDSSRPVSPLPRFRVLVEEEGAGLDFDGVHLDLDGAELETEFDPDRGWATAEPSTPLSPGRHEGKVWAVDRAGNRSAERTFRFTVR